MVCVSEAFEGVSRVKRQMAVNAILKDEFDGGLHSLTMSLHTPSEYEAKEESYKEATRSALKQARALTKARRALDE